MKLRSTPKPVRYRITSGGLEHSSLDSLLQHFNYEDLKNKWPSVIRWLERQGSVAEDIANKLKEEPNPTFEEAIGFFWGEENIIDVLNNWINEKADNLKFLRLDYFYDNPDAFTFSYEHKESLAVFNFDSATWLSHLSNIRSLGYAMTEELLEIENKIKDEMQEKELQRQEMLQLEKLRQEKLRQEIKQRCNLILLKIIEIEKEIRGEEYYIQDELSLDTKQRLRYYYLGEFDYKVDLRGIPKRGKEPISLADFFTEKVIVEIFHEQNVWSNNLNLYQYRKKREKIIDKIRCIVKQDMPSTLSSYKEILAYCRINDNDIQWIQQLNK